MQLEAVVLQETSEERVDWKSNASYKEGDEAHSFPLGRVGEIFRQGFAI